MDSITIIPYNSDYQPDFKSLNMDWISRYFTVEPHDLEQLDQPETYILPNNGQILFAQLNDEIVGCVAMVNTGMPDHGMPDHGMPDHGLPDHGEISFELAKMAVAPGYQGKGIGKMLCTAAIDYARQLGATIVWLESNRVLTPALSMYASAGFREVPGVPTPYSRADIRMEMAL